MTTCVVITCFIVALCFPCVSGTNLSAVILVEDGSWLTGLTDLLPSLEAEGNNQVKISVIEESQYFEFVTTDRASWHIVVDLSGTEDCMTDQAQLHESGHIFLTQCSDRIERGSNDSNANLVLGITPILPNYGRALFDVVFKDTPDAEKLVIFYEESSVDFAYVSQTVLGMTSVLMIEITANPQIIRAAILHSTTEPVPIDFIIIAPFRTVDVVLQTVSQMVMFQDHHKWVLYVTDAKEHTCDYPGAINVIAIENVNDETGQPESIKQTIMSDITTLISGILLSANNGSSFDVLRTGLMSAAKSTCDDMPRCRITENNTLSIQSTVNIVEISNHSGAASCSVEQIGNWSTESGLQTSSQLFEIYSNKVDMRVVTVVEPPFVFKDDGGNFSGYSVELLDHVAHHLNMTYTIRDCTGGVYGTLGDNDTWSGCIGMVHRGEADLVIGSLTVTLERDLVVDFTLPCFDFAGIHILMRKKSDEGDLFYFTTVFSPMVWVCIGGVLVTVSVLLVVFDKVSPCSRRAKGDDSKRITSIKDSLWFAIGSITLSDCGDTPRCSSSRILIAGFWFFCFIVMSTFTANLAALLTTDRLKVSVASLDDLAKQSKVKFSVVKDSSTMMYFKSMAKIEEDFHQIWKAMSFETDNENQNYEVWEYPVSEEFSAIWEKLQNNGLLDNTEQAFTHLKDSEFAFITESPIVKYYTAKDCNLASIGEQFSVRPYAMALREDSSYTEKISEALLKLQSERTFEELKRKWWNSSGSTCEEVDVNGGLSMENLAGNFIVAGIGVFAGFLVLFIEIVAKKMRNKPANGGLSTSWSNGPATKGEHTNHMSENQRI